MSDTGSVAPKERINIVYKPATGNQQEQVELPLKVMVVGDFKGGPQQATIENREAVSVTPTSLDSVVAHYAPELNINVADKLSDKPNPDGIDLNLTFNSMKDFHPDNLARNFPALSKLMELRDALRALKGPLGNVAQFRRHLSEIISDDGQRAALLKELNINPTPTKAAAPAGNGTPSK